MKPIPTTVLVTPPADLAVTLEQTKLFLRIDNDVEDDTINILIKAAITRIEKYIDHKLITQTWDILFDRFPCSGSSELDGMTGVVDASRSVLSGGGGKIYLPIGRVQSITSFHTFDDAGTSYLFDASQYVVDTSSLQGRISLKLGGVWPATVLRTLNGIKIRAVVGYGTSPESIPEPITHALLLTIAKLYENRGDSSDGEFFGFAGFTLPNTAMMLLEPYRKIKVG